jgi:hypothetical protein
MRPGRRTRAPYRAGETTVTNPPDRTLHQQVCRAGSQGAAAIVLLQSKRSADVSGFVNHHDRYLDVSGQFGKCGVRLA